MHKVRLFHFTFDCLFYRHIRRILLMKNATALLSQAQWTAQAIACLIALLLPCFNVQINASGSLTMFVRFRTPNPEGEFESSRKLHTSPIQNLRQILGFAICWNITGSNPFRCGGEIPKEFEASTCGSFFVPFGWFRLHPRNGHSNTTCFPKCIGFKSNASEYP